MDGAPCPAGISRGVYVVFGTHVCGQAVGVTIRVPGGAGIPTWRALADRYNITRPAREYHLLKNDLTQRCDHGYIAAWVEKKVNDFLEIERMWITPGKILMAAIMSLLPKSAKR